jgi:nitrogen fixation protein FixH
MTATSIRPGLRIHWGLAIALVYGTFAAATIAFVVFALRQPVDLVSPDYYARSLQQDDRTAAERRAAALAAGIACRIDSGTLTVTVPPEASRQAAGTLTLYRPSDGRADRVVPLALDATGIQRVPLAGVARGRWQLQLAWTAGGLRYYHEQRLDVP